MNIEGMDELGAGRELDALIAEHLFSFVWLDPARDGINRMRFLASPDRAKVWLEMGAVAISDMALERYGDWDTYVPKFSTTWEGAGMALDYLHAQGWEITTHMTQDDYFLNECLISKPGWRDEDRLYGRSESLLVAICRAALKTVAPQAVTP